MVPRCAGASWRMSARPVWWYRAHGAHVRQHRGPQSGSLGVVWQAVFRGVAGRGGDVRVERPLIARRYRPSTRRPRSSTARNLSAQETGTVSCSASGSSRSDWEPMTEPERCFFCAARQRVVTSASSRRTSSRTPNGCGSASSLRRLACRDHDPPIANRVARAFGRRAGLS